jgi:hypothetical protein
MPGIVVHETKELDILVLNGMGPDTMESGTRPQVLCHDSPVKALFSSLWLS